MRYVVTARASGMDGVNGVIKDINEFLAVVDIQNWQEAEVSKLYALIDNTNKALETINQHGISNESLKLFDVTDDIMSALNADSPKASLEAQEEGIWEKIKAFFKELWRRITTAFHALLGKVDKDQASKAEAALKASNNAEEICKLDWANRLYKAYTVEELDLIKSDVIHCITFLKMCHELDLKTVVSEDPEVYAQFEKKFVESANAIFGVKVDMSKEESNVSLSKWLPFTRKVDNDSKQFSIKLNFAEERGKQCSPGIPKTEFGYRTANDLAKLTYIDRDLIDHLQALCNLLDKINANIDKYMEVFEEPMRKILPPISLHKVRALLNQIPRACSACTMQAFQASKLVSKMVSVVVQQLSGRSTDEIIT